MPDDLVAAARHLLDDAPRALLGLTGVPGAGKTTLAVGLVAALNAASPGTAVHVPMDGYHLADRVLEAHGTRDRKGAAETFDGWGYLELLRLLRSRPDHAVFAPGFDRDLEQPLAGSIEVPSGARLVVSEGNYLLLGHEPWSLVRDVFDEVWFCEADPDRRMTALVQRHVTFGKAPEVAREWIASVDEPNAALVAATRGRADRVVTTF
ncbi:nucleoside/nucleotide kinase family protein [Phycicoccus sp. MQZ13P-5]|uniref:Nucleoside/nucleotide kinase family protein n=1 Tax=Phycicoccus sonneratiae TaxID=2807628 RepID=A0ABS2CIA7_9MICO|nr:nucleoside/nucleotide kinase family protein [Phycicoccus sonneraticus]